MPGVKSLTVLGHAGEGTFLERDEQFKVIEAFRAASLVDVVEDDDGVVDDIRVCEVLRRHGAEPRTVNRQARVGVVQADEGQHRHLAAVPEAQREDAGPVARAPAARARQQRAQGRRVGPGGQGFGVGEEPGLAVQADEPAARLHEGGRVVLAGGVAVVGAEDEGHAGGVHGRQDLGVQLGAGLALGLAEGGGVDGLGPQHRVHLLALHEVAELAHLLGGAAVLVDEDQLHLAAAEAGLVVRGGRLAGVDGLHQHLGPVAGRHAEGTGGGAQLGHTSCAR